MYRLCQLFVIALMLFAGPAEAATLQGNAVIAQWKLMDVCARQAQTAYPDFTAEENAKREAELQRCLQRGNLPPRQLLSAPPPH
ncbi:MAG TPA: hypothetical protein VGR91_19740 [Stellaceae bacterium]|nr:hypothetical protein [Stellaceae bacterium]